MQRNENGWPVTCLAFGELTPQQWAMQILKIKTIDGRRQHLMKVPALIRGLVEDMVRGAFDRRQALGQGETHREDDPLTDRDDQEAMLR